MKKICKRMQFALLVFVVCCSLFLMTFFIIAGINWRTNNALANPNIKEIAAQLQKTDDGFELSREAQDVIDSYGGFAILIGEDGQVIWDYKRPDQIPTYYSRTDIASFSRWYLKDYPVSTWILDRNLFVIGQPKGSVWKYEVSYGMNTMNAYILYLPILLLVDSILFIIIPIRIYRKNAWKKERQRTEWIAGVSHDIRTPLALVLGNAAAIKEKTEEESIQEKADLIEKHAIRMRTLIANLNMENKLSYGLGKWNREEIMFAALVRDVLCDVMNQEENERFEFDINIDQDLEAYKIWGDSDLVRRLIENLVWNAIRHNPQGCCIHISLQRQKRKRKNVLFTIRDDGAGVSQEQLSRLNAKVTADDLPEHGLGIRLVKHIAALYHWKLRFYHAQERGLICEIRISGGIGSF